MATTITLNGVSYTIPAIGDEGVWGENLDAYFIAIPQAVLQKSGGNFTLTAAVNFGANYGLLSKLFSTRTANPSSAGLLRLAVSDSVGWRNNAHDGDLLLAVNGSDQLTFNGSVLAAGGTVTSVALTVPNILSVAGSPITTSGTLAVTLATQTTKTFLGGPISGIPATPTFRILATTDLPAGITVRASGATTTITTSATIIINGTETYDATGIYDNTTGRATIAEAGKYRIGGYIQTTASFTNGDTLKLQVFKNGSLYSTIAAWLINDGIAGISGCDTVDCAINDIIDLRGITTNSSFTLTSDSYITIEKVG